MRRLRLVFEKFLVKSEHGIFLRTGAIKAL